MEAAFIAIADRLQVAGLSPEETARQLEDGASDPSHWIADDLCQLAAWAKVGGWKEDEIGAGVHSLVENFRLSVEANRETEREIRRARREPEDTERG